MMTGPNAGATGRRGRLATRAVAVLAGVLGAGCVAFGQDLGQDQGMAPAKDTIFARKILMDTIGFNMDEIETMTNSPDKVPLSDAHNHADVISVMLQAFPHLFPPGDQSMEAERRAGRRDRHVRLSRRLDALFGLLQAGGRLLRDLALDASRAETEANSGALAAKLRTACDGCHTLYQKPD